jgi:hypothetical protein
MNRFPILRVLAPLALVSFLAGCSQPASFGHSIQPAPGASGSVFGGQQPVVGAVIQIYTVGITGDGSNSTALLTGAPVTSGADGSFILPAYSCTGTTEVYLTATGGDPLADTPNPNLVLMTALGSCTALKSQAYVEVNELTTVAAAYALGPFAKSDIAIGSGSGDAGALVTAFALAAEYVDTSTGEIPGVGLPSGFMVPLSEIDTLGNIMSSCVNSGGGAAGQENACGSLFTLTTPTVGGAPTTTFLALLNVAKQPTLNTPALFLLQPKNSPFYPFLDAAPADFTVALIPIVSQLQVSPGSITFPYTSVGVAATAVPVMIENVGNVAVTVGSIAVTGTNATDFGASSTCTVALQPGDSCMALVGGTPGAAGVRTASLSVVSDAANSPDSVGLMLPGVAAGTPGPLTIGTGYSWTVAGTVGDIPLSNYGVTPITITGMKTGTAQFAVVGSSCGDVIPAQSVCTVSVESLGLSGDDTGGMPIATTYNDTLTISDSGTNSPQTAALTSTNTVGVGLGTYGGLGVNETFGEWPVGYTETLPMTIILWKYSVPGQIPLELAGNNPLDFALSDSNFQPPIAPSQSITECPEPELGGCSFSISFTPTAGGASTAQILAGSGYLSISGTGETGAAFQVVTTPDNPGSAPLGATNVATTTVTVPVNNRGATVLSPNIVTLSGPAASNFSVTTAGCTGLAILSSCNVVLGFSATAPGYYLATVTVEDSVSTITHSAPLGVVVEYGSVVRVTGATHPLPDQLIGTVSSGTTITIADQNQSPLGHPVSVTFPPGGPFLLPNGNTCPANATQVCTLAVAFAPQTAGVFSQQLTATDLTTGYTNSLTVSGTGIYPPALSLSTNTVSFLPHNVGTMSTPMTVTVNSTGAGPLTVSSVVITGDASGSFSQSNNCGTVAAGNSCTVNITFDPTVSGPLGATVQIVSNAASSPDMIDVSGTGQ